MTRRVVICDMDAAIERPELRRYKNDPVKLVLDDRGRYVAAALIVARSYQAAGSPNKLPPLASYEAWSDLVRSALVWLGGADPVATVTSARDGDPELQNLSDFLVAWAGEIGIGLMEARTAGQVIEAAEARGAPDGAGPPGWACPNLREAVQMINAVGPTAPRILAQWLSKNHGRPVRGLKLAKIQKGDRAIRWYVADA